MVASKTHVQVSHGFGSSAVTLTCRLLIVLLSLVTSSCGATLVHEVNKGSLAKFLQGKFFALTYVDSTGCARCRNLYPYYVATAQTFPDDPEIFFTRTYDKELIKEWGVSELPALVYHREGSDKPSFFDVDVTVDDIIDEIARVLHGTFGTMEKHYSVRLTNDNYDEIVTTPKQSVMILIHDEDSSATLDIIEKAAYAFRKDDAILFAALNADNHESLRNDRFLTRDVPSLMWLSSTDKSSPKRFGGMQTHHLLVTFVNEQTGLNRNVDGAMNPEAGRIPELDELLTEHADIIDEAEPDRLNLLALEINKRKDSMEPHMIDMFEYYVFILDNIGMTGSKSVLEELFRGLESRIYEDEELSTKGLETLKRHKNIVSFFKDLMRKFASGEWAKLYDGQSTLADRAAADAAVTFDPQTHVHTEL